MNTDLIICECHSAEHQILFRHDSEWDEIYIEIHLNNYSFFRRLKYAIKYIFGYKSKYGAWDEIMVDKNNFKKIINNIK